MKLSRELGFHGDVEAMLETLTNEQYAEWVVLYTEEGFPEDRADWRNARAIAEMMHMAGKTLKADAEVKLRDFMPKFWQEKDDAIKAGKPRVLSPNEQAELEEKGRRFAEAMKPVLEKVKHGT